MTIGIGKEREGLNYLEWARELQSKFDCSLADLFKENGILHQTTCTYTPQQNNIVECKNNHILEGYKCFHPPTSKYYVSMNVQFYEMESYFSRNVSLVPLQEEIGSNEEEKLWLEEKKL
ncbi:hypothetical protein AAG906_006384 [Vitis piasezkii]